jgi:hypothetical protein
MEWRFHSHLTRSVTTIEEWIWKFDVEYKLIGFCGADPDKRVVLQGRTGTVEIITTSDKSPRPEVRVVDPIEVNITWLLRDAAAFKIDRSKKSTRTPRRNDEVEAALSSFEALHSWCARVASYFQSSVFSAQALDKLDMGSINDNGVFVPFVPLMLPPSGAEAKSGTLLPAQDQQAFINEQKRSLEAKLTALGKSFADEKKLVTGAEAMLLSAAAHIQSIAVRYSHCVDYIEYMLEQQLIAAVGKTLQPKDFGEYMQFHARRLFANAFAPKPFVYAIRRPDHCPEGLLTVETDTGDGSLEQPLQSIVSVSNAKSPMFFSLGAATRAALFGERYLHGAILHQFSHQTDVSLRLTARARQFSSFVLLAGKIASADTFEPTHAVIIQNKDDVLVPLLLEQIPSAKAFRDAIESLSPEQQRFAKAFRAMQLESTLFGVAVVEIKPQLERLLKLNADALTKEIRLTQDLMELFIEYQVPSDLLAYDGKEDRDVAHKISEVKRNVQAVQDMIKAAKEKELEEEKQKAEFERANISRFSSRALPAKRSICVCDSGTTRRTTKLAREVKTKSAFRRCQSGSSLPASSSRMMAHARRYHLGGVDAPFGDCDCAGGPEPKEERGANEPLRARERTTARRLTMATRAARSRQGRFRRRRGGDRLHAGAGRDGCQV